MALGPVPHFVHPSALKIYIAGDNSSAVIKLVITLQMGKAYCITIESISLERCNSICGFTFQKEIFLLLLEISNISILKYFC